MRLIFNYLSNPLQSQCFCVVIAMLLPCNRTLIATQKHCDYCHGVISLLSAVHLTICLSSLSVSYKVIEDYSIFEKNSLRLLYFFTL